MKGLDRLLAPLQRRVMLMIGRAVLAVVDDEKKLQSIQINLLADETRDDVERFQDYGFTSHPHPGAEAIAVSVMGTRDHTVVIKVDDRRYRLKALEQGEVALYTDEGDKIVLKRGNHIEVTAATDVTLITPLTILTGDLHVMGHTLMEGTLHVVGDTSLDSDLALGGSGTVTGDFTAKGKSLPHHNHMEQGDGSPTSPPL